MRKYIIYAVMSVCMLLLQCSFFSHFMIGGMVPNLLVILTASIAISRGSLEGCITGFICGLLLDFTFPAVSGMYALIYTIVGYMAGIPGRIIYKEDITFPIIVITGTDIFCGLLVFIIGFLMRGRTNIIYYLVRIILPEAAYTAVISIFLYRVILFIIQKTTGRKGSENLIV